MEVKGVEYDAPSYAKCVSHAQKKCNEWIDKDTVLSGKVEGTLEWASDLPSVPDNINLMRLMQLDFSTRRERRRKKLPTTTRTTPTSRSNVKMVICRRLQQDTSGGCSIDFRPT